MTLPYHVRDMPSVRDDAIVLTRIDYSESSQVIAFLTREHGKVRALAKGLKRGTRTRFAVGTDLLDIGEIVVISREERGPGLATLTEWKSTRSLIGLRDSLPRYYAAQYAAEVTTHLTEDWDPHIELFDALYGSLSGLSGGGEPLPIIVRYQAQLLCSIGSRPRLEACVMCGRTRELTFFSSQEGGMICRHCEPGKVEKRAIMPDAVTLLQRMAAVEDLTPPGHVASDVAEFGAFDLLDYHISHLMGRVPLLSGKVVPPERRRVLR